MIKNTILPATIGNFVLFTDRNTVIQITKTAIYVAYVTTKGSKYTIEKIIEQPIENNEQLTPQEHVIAALKKIASQLPKNSTVTVIISSDQVVYKELTLPLMATEKLKLIVPFEIEKLLPFPSANASIDSLVMQENAEQQQSTVLAVAIKKDVLDNYLQMFSAAGIPVSRVSTDIIELFALYRALPKADAANTPTVLIDSGVSYTSVALINHGQLSAVRVIPQGLSDMAQGLGTAPEHLVQTGLSSFSAEQLQSSSVTLIKNIMLTLESFKTKLAPGSALSKIVLSGQGADVNGLAAFLAEQTKIPCEILSTQTIVQHHAIATVPRNLTNTFTTVIAAGLRYPLTKNFNLDQAAEETERTSLINKQILTMIILLAILFGTIIIITFITNHRLQQEYTASEQQALTVIKEKFGFDKTLKGRLPEIINRARADLENQRRIWSSLSPENRSSALVYLQEIFTRIDRESLGLQMYRLTLNTDTDVMTLEGRVKDYESLRLLEEELRRSKMVKDVSKLQELRFTAKITLETM